VSKGNDDLANSESLKLARKVDPQGVRTLGVVTQIDIMIPGTDILNDLMNKTYPLKLGYVGVVLRGIKDIEEKKTIQQQIIDE
jgi:dynamin 1-like protein